ncbi:hypothetical protein Tco_0614163, partial [Tanacetum coccineum]
MVKMCRAETGQLRDSGDTRRLLQHALRPQIGRDKGNAVG